MRRPQLRAFLSPLLALAALAASVPDAHAADLFETRTYLDLALLRPLAPARGPLPHLGPFLREESRFRSAGLAYVKTFAGLRAAWSPALRAALYYAHTDKVASARSQGHIAALDLFATVARGPVQLTDKSGFEAHHAPAVFFRYRNALELRVAPWGDAVTPFALGELRVDGDSFRFELRELRLGVELRPVVGLSLRVFYAREGNRRGKRTWTEVDILGLAVAARL